jgi:hypothetical protein
MTTVTWQEVEYKPDTQELVPSPPLPPPPAQFTFTRPTSTSMCAADAVRELQAQRATHP